MTRPLRTAHAVIWAVLPLLLVLTLALALAVRRNPAPPNTGLHWETTP